ncbi:hypothetical protein ACFCX4_12210 [Kitasatospora sp. NPDC056327]|uniref:hypothetical protein n=1 Tax=Kitasatospora sp. NPDC056327 TaxID=3345785 RepID=UPI0035E329F8
MRRDDLFTAGHEDVRVAVPAFPAGEVLPHHDRRPEHRRLRTFPAPKGCPP